jgi:hypothetical protein
MQPEARLTNKIRLAIVARGGHAVKIHGGRFQAGHPDLTAVYRSVPLFIEVKVPGRESTLTVLQKTTLAKWQAAGAVAIMSSSVEHVERILDAIDARAREPFRD